MKNLDQVKSELIDKGLMSEDIVHDANVRTLLIKGEWTRDNKIMVKTYQGLSGEGIIGKYVEDSFSLPEIMISEDIEEVERKFISDLRSMYIGFRVFVQMD